MTNSRIIAYIIMASSLFASTALAATPGTDDNLSLMRQVSTSSCFDYNLTGQLLTDGILTTTMPLPLPLATPTDLCHDANANGL